MLPASRILIVEDEKDIQLLLKIHLERCGFLIDIADNGTVAFEKMRGDQRYDLIVLDRMLPEIDGLELLRFWRGSANPNPRSPVLMVTARTEPDDIVQGLETGADDYVTKPFDTAVLVARVRALLRRQEKKPNTAILEIENLRIDTERHEVRCSGELVSVTPYEFKLLTCLVENRGRVLTRDQLVDQVQGEDVSVIRRTVDTHVFGLRKKLGNCAELVETIRGVGYRVRG